MPNGPTSACTLLSIARTADLTHAYIYEQGYACQNCRHRHLGHLGEFGCLRCACPLRGPNLGEFQAMRIVRFTGEIVTMLPDGSVLELLPVKADPTKAVH